MPAEGTCTAQDCDCVVVMQCTWTIERKEKITLFGVKLLRSQVLYWAAQA